MISSTRLNRTPVLTGLTLFLLAAAPALARQRAVPQATVEATSYIYRHPEVTTQQPLEVHYETREREAFWIRAAAYEMRFRLAPPGIGVDLFRLPDAPAALARPAAFDIHFELSQASYHSSLARSPARINIFRHGPHYYDVHVFDLHPTSADGDTLPVRVELIFHAYPERLFLETRLHPTTEGEPGEVTLEWTLASEDVARYLVEGEVQPAGDERSFVRRDPERGFAMGAALVDGRAFGLVLSEPAGTRELQLAEDGDTTRIRQVLDSSFRDESGHRAAYARLVVSDPAGLARAHVEEASPLPEDAVAVGDGVTWTGYDARRGYYTLSTRSGYPVSWFFEHPRYRASAPFSIANDALPRKLYIRHEDAARSDRLGAGVVTDALGLALPVLVQGSKNFSGEEEEPFYDPGDPAYSEIYFPLVLDANERILLQSILLAQNWGRFPIKQVSSLQAWMPYYQMSVGVTETTCYVPFRFGGFPGIWIADLRGLSGTRWSSQPQYDNVGGHRFFHYTAGGKEHFGRFLRSRFRMTGPNMVWWGMEYETDDGAARLQLETMEFPQSDETRSFAHLRVDFQDTLTIARPGSDLHLLSIDTRTQQLLYGRAGYLARGDSLVSIDLRAPSAGPREALLSRRFPVFGLFDVLPESPQEGNNAVLVRRFVGQASGEPLAELAVRLDTLGDGQARLSLTLPGGPIRFAKGDYLDLELLLMPYGKTGAGFEAPLAERRRYGLNPPTVQVSRGTAVSPFPSVVRIAEDGPTEFIVSGGYGVIPVLVEGFASHVPPPLERKGRLGWQPVPMTVDGADGYQTYLAGDGSFGFVFLVETDGSPIPFRLLR